MTNIHFSHANGFPAKTYQYLFSLLDNQKINYVDTMGHSNYPDMKQLNHLRDELIDDIRLKSDQPVVGIGHSSGAAATLLAAAKAPELFERVILLDPVALGKRKRVAIELSKKVGLWKSISPAKKAQRRRSEFQNAQQAFDYYQTKALFKNFHPKCFASYIEHGLVSSGEGVKLKFLPQVEADIFSNVPTRIPKDLSKIKGTIIYAEQSNLFGPSDIKWWKRKHPHFEMICFPGEHLFPLEKPEETAKVLNLLFVDE